MGKLIEIKSKDLKKAPWNYKTENEEISLSFINQVKKNGLVVTMLVRELTKGKYEIIDGNHRKDVVDQLGIKSVHAFNLGKITQKKAEQIAIEINETKFEADLFKMAEIFLSSKLTNEQLAETMPFSAQEINDFKEILTFDWDNMDLTKEELDQEVELPENETITLSYPSEKAEIFEEAINDFLKRNLYVELL